MRFSQLLYAFAGVVALLLAPADSFAHRIYFTPVGAPPPPLIPPDQGGVTEQPLLSLPGNRNGKPEFTLNVDDSIDVHVWINPDDTTGTVNRRFASIGLDIEASAAGVASPTGFVMVNPENLESGGTVPNRWNSFGVDAVPGAGNFWVKNAFGASVNTPGVASRDNATNQADQARDDITNDYYLGTLTLHGDAEGVIGLYFRNGRSKNVVAGQTVHPIQYGDSAQTYDGDAIGPTVFEPNDTRPTGDPITADLALADAIIRVMGPPPPSRDVLSRFNDPNTLPDVTLSGPNGGIPKNVPFNSSEGTLIVENWTDSFFDVFVDIAGDDATAELAAVLLESQANNTMEADGYLVIRSPRPDDLGLGVDYDFFVRSAVTPGDDQTFDFDFAGTPFIVANLGIPEPSSVALSAMALVGMAFYGWRRRRSA